MTIPTARSGIPVNQILDGAAFWTATQLMGAGKFEEAAECALDLLARYPDHAEALYVLGFVAFYGHDNPAAAAELFGRALAQRPAFSECHYNRGYMLQRIGGHDDEVIQCYTRALELDPRFAGAWVNLGNAKLARADVDGALACYEKAKKADASNALARYNRSIAFLLTGSDHAGWTDYEARLETPLFKARLKLPTHLPLWDGSPLNGRRLLVCAEQGMGDTIMCYRYASQLPGAIWCVQGSLVPLLGGVDYDARPWPDADCYVPTMSLMHRLGHPTSGPAYLPRNPE